MNKLFFHTQATPPKIWNTHHLSGFSNFSINPFWTMNDSWGMAEATEKKEFGKTGQKDPKRRWRNPLGRLGCRRETWDNILMGQYGGLDQPKSLPYYICVSYQGTVDRRLESCPPEGQAGPIQKTNPGNWSGWSEIKQVHILKNNGTPDDKDRIFQNLTSEPH